MSTVGLALGKTEEQQLREENKRLRALCDELRGERDTWHQSAAHWQRRAETASLAPVMERLNAIHTDLSDLRSSARGIRYHTGRLYRAFIIPGQSDEPTPGQDTVDA